MSSRMTYLAAAFACTTTSMFGYGTGYIGGILVLPSLNHHFRLDHLSERDLAFARSLIVSIWLLGALSGVICAVPICSHFGRKNCFLFCAINAVIGVALQLVPNNMPIAVFDIGRFLNGVGAGAGTLVTPLYLSEISRSHERGTLMAMFQVVIQISALIGFWGAYASHAVFPDVSNLQWQIPTAFQFIPGVVLLLAHPWLTESPVWLVERGNLNACHKSLAWLRSLDESSPDICLEVNKFYEVVVERKTLELRHPDSTSFKQIFRSPTIRKRLITGIGLMTLNTIGGTNALNFFAPTIFAAAGFTSTSASLFLTGLFGFVKLCAALGFMFYFVHAKGHRLWLVLGSGICTVAMFVLGFCVKSFESEKIRPYGSGSVNLNWPGVVACLMVFSFAFFFGIGLGPISWNFCAEVFPAHISTKCSAITTCTQWSFQIINAIATPLLLATVGWYTFVIFGWINAFSLFWCAFYVPETRNVPLGKQMDAVFDGKVKPGPDADGTVEEPANEESPLLPSRLRSRFSVPALGP